MFMLFDDKVEADSVQKTGILATQSRCYKINEGVSKLIHPLFILPLPCLPHNSLFTAAMLLISYKMIYRALNSLYKLV